MKAILFDFGGTLDTDGIHWSEKFWDVYSSAGIKIEKKKYEEAYVYAESRVQGVIKNGDTMEDVLGHQVLLQAEYLFAKGYLSAGNQSAIVETLKGQCYKEVVEYINKYMPLLEQLKTKYKLAVVSNFYGNLSCVLKELEIKRFFDVIVDSEIEGVKKPDPEIFLIAVKRLNLFSGETVVVGDSYDWDIVPAKMAGCKTIWLDGKSWTRPAGTGEADIIIHTLDKLTSALNELEKKTKINFN